MLLTIRTVNWCFSQLWAKGGDPPGISGKAVENGVLVGDQDGKV